MYKEVILKKNRDRPVVKKHHWIYSQAIERWPEFEDGEILRVISSDARVLGFGYFNKRNTIAGRMLSFGDNDPIEAIRRNIKQAFDLRESVFEKEKTNAYRLINAEGDGIPGLTVDRYNDTLVVQISTLGIDLLKDVVVETLVDVVKPKNIYEKSSMPSRRLEGLESFKGFLFGEENNVVNILENGFKFEINLEKSHKTGFYLDQREMRTLIGSLSKDKKILNCFSYTGGFSIYSASNGAKHVTSIDISEEVIEQSKKNFELNKLDQKNHKFEAIDTFEFLAKDKLDYDIVILDPPAFAKKKNDFNNAFKAYRKLNSMTFKKVPKNTLVLTCSCSYHVSEGDFKRAIFEAGLEAKREIRVLQSHRHAFDHVLNLYHPELNYLKSFLLYVN